MKTLPRRSPPPSPHWIHCRNRNCARVPRSTAPLPSVTDFINAVAAIETSLAPRALLDALLALELARGRTRKFVNAPRTLDLDVLLYGDRQITEPGLSVPHPRMHERAFVLVPLAEIAPDCVVPGRGAVAALLRNIDISGVRREECARAAVPAA